MEKLTEYKGQPLTFVESINVKEGVICDVYTYDNDPGKDLGVVTVNPGAKTPFQKILQDDETLQIYQTGTGIFRYVDEAGNKQEFQYPSGPAVTSMQHGELMQWEATGEGDLVYCEVCTPPYQDGRYENLPE